MKKSELTIVDGVFFLTPDSWGEQAVIVDEEAARECIRDAYDLDALPEEPLDEMVQIGRSAGGYYVISSVPERIRSCGDPNVAEDGLVEMWGCWESFDEEDD